MFSQVRVPQTDQDALRILWFPEPQLQGDPVVYRMRVHSFGVTSSPFCANFALRKTAEKFGKSYGSVVQQAVLQHFYVDDCVASFSDEDSAFTFVCGITEMIAKGGFRLTKWLLNSIDILNHIAPADRAASVKCIDDNRLPTERTLGIKWDAYSDEFIFSFKLTEGSLTRRGILSTISGLYDLLGFVATWLLPRKVLLQQLCPKKMGWDQQLDESDKALLTSWLTSMRRLNDLRVPRCIDFSFVKCLWIEVHIFCDALETGYGAVAYAVKIFAKRVLRMCFTCRKLNATLGQQIMAPLPTFRTKPGWFPFMHVGIDYFGPIAKKHGRSLEKRYGCLITCLQSRAVHIVVASFLSTDFFGWLFCDLLHVVKHLQIYIQIMDQISSALTRR